MAKFLYANGMNKFSAARVCKYIFGDFFKKVEVDEDLRMFNIMIYEKIESANGEELLFVNFFDSNYRERFKDAWGTPPGFKLKIVNEKDIDEDN
jgi:hypothetical protein